MALSKSGSDSLWLHLEVRCISVRHNALLRRPSNKAGSVQLRELPLCLWCSSSARENVNLQVRERNPSGTPLPLSWTATIGSNNRIEVRILGGGSHVRMET